MGGAHTEPTLDSDSRTALHVFLHCLLHHPQLHFQAMNVFLDLTAGRIRREDGGGAHRDLAKLLVGFFLCARFLGLLCELELSLLGERVTQWQPG
jgi:hypothetical protein